MKESLGKIKINKLFTPDFILSLILLGVAIRFSSEVSTWFDIPQSDDNVYMHGGIYFLEILNDTRDSTGNNARGV